jgi:TMEM175 potassium channel family protein
MRAAYNLIAGQSVERLAALSDGVFAVAMTLLVLDLRAPAAAAIHSERELWTALVALAPRLIPYLMTFLTLGIFWVGQQTQLNGFTRSDRDLTWIHIGFMLAVTLMPFSTALLAEFISFRAALITYWLNIVLLGAALYASWRYARRAGLLKDMWTPELREAVERRIIVAQALYAFGALLCLVNTYVSIAVIVIVQLNYVIAPRIWPL